MALASELRDVAAQIGVLEQRANVQAVVIDHLADLHNDLTDWATNTEHEQAALEVMSILEQYIQKSKATGTGVNNGRHHKAAGQEGIASIEGSEEAIPAG
jgi:hypothetical protein